MRRDKEINISSVRLENRTKVMQTETSALPIVLAGIKFESAADIKLIYKR